MNDKGAANAKGLDESNQFIKHKAVFSKAYAMQMSGSSGSTSAVSIALNDQVRDKQDYEHVVHFVNQSNTENVTEKNDTNHDNLKTSHGIIKATKQNAH